MRIIYVDREQRAPDPAPALQVHHTLRGICEAGAEVRFVTPWPVRLVRERCAVLTGREFPEGLEVVSLGSGPDLPIVARLWPTPAWNGIAARLRRHVRNAYRRRPDTVIYTRSRRAVAALSGGAYPPVVFERHEPHSVGPADESGCAEDDPSVRTAFGDDQAALENAAALVTVNQAEVEEAGDRDRFSSRRWVIPNGVDPTIFSVPHSQRRPRLGQLLYIGSINPCKGLDLLLGAVARVPAARLTICGGRRDSKPWQDIAGLVSRLGIGQRVRMAGLLAQQNLRPYLASAMAGILPLNGQYAVSERHACPLNLFEYLCAGLPVVATDLPSVRNIVVHEREALLFEDRKVSSLARTLVRLMDDTALTRRLANRARETSAEHTWRHRGQQIVQVCQTVLRQRRAA